MDLPRLGFLFLVRNGTLKFLIAKTIA